MRLLPAAWPDRRANLNAFLGSLRRFKAARDIKSALAAPAPPPLPLPDLPPAELAAGPGKLLQVETRYGCSKCRHAPTGCASCCPSKAARWADKHLKKIAASQASQS